jgi:uncharacterized RDD family membrane protein YckC
MSYLPDPQSHPELFQGVLARRAVAWLIDLVVLGMLVLALLLGGLFFGVVTLGLGFLALPIAVPVAVLAYYALTLGSAMRATLGMRAMDIVLTPARGRPLDGWAILIHPLVFWVTVWISWPITVAIALFTPRRQLVHDLIAGTLMVRRSPMERRFRYADA